MSTSDAGAAAPVDVAVVGLGPAGRALAAACLRAGLRVAAVDPAPERRWPATYGAFTADLAGLDVPLAAVVERPVARTAGGGTAAVAGAYAVLDTDALQAGLDLTGARRHVARAAQLAPTAVHLAGGGVVAARVVVDARGATGQDRTVQTAFGVVVPTARAEPLLAGADGVFMDWRPEHGAGPAGAPTFCYVVPLGGGRVLLEETSLAARPGLTATALRARLHHRLARHGITLTGDEPTERVRFALDTPLPRAEWRGRAPGVLRVGAAGPLVHPATGYNLAASLHAAPQLAAVLAAGGTAADAHRALWPAAARTVHALRLRGLRALVGFDADETDRFFAAFFALAPSRQRAYLAGRTDVAGTAGAMTALLPHLDARLRRRLVTGAVLPAVRR